jgi:hypothetical protein
MEWHLRYSYTLSTCALVELHKFPSSLSFSSLFTDISVKDGPLFLKPKTKTKKTRHACVYTRTNRPTHTHTHTHAHTHTHTKVTSDSAHATSIKNGVLLWKYALFRIATQIGMIRCFHTHMSMYVCMYLPHTS